jgi:hypothetical protein
MLFTVVLLSVNQRLSLESSAIRFGSASRVGRLYSANPLKFWNIPTVEVRGGSICDTATTLLVTVGLTSVEVITAGERHEGVPRAGRIVQ